MKHQDIEALPKVSQVKLDLIAGKALIADPARWCQGADYDKRGARCSRGAIARATECAANFDRYSAAYDALLQAIPLVNTVASSVECYNDASDHAAVMAWWDSAIAKA